MPLGDTTSCSILGSVRVGHSKGGTKAVHTGSLFFHMAVTKYWPLQEAKVASQRSHTLSLALHSAPCDGNNNTTALLHPLQTPVFVFRSAIALR